MDRFERLTGVITGLMTLALSVILFLDTDDGLIPVAIILSFALVLTGLRSLVYYFTMARHMVGGKAILFTAMILLDAGTLSFALVDGPTAHLIAYLVGLHAVSGVILLLSAMESRMAEAPWRLRACQGILTLLVAVACLVFSDNPVMIVRIYALGLALSGLMRIGLSLSEAEIVYVP